MQLNVVIAVIDRTLFRDVIITSPHCVCFRGQRLVTSEHDNGVGWGKQPA